MKIPRVSPLLPRWGLALALGGAVGGFLVQASTRGSNGTATAVLTGNFDNPNVPQSPEVINPLNVLRADKGGLNGSLAVSADPAASGLGQMKFQNWSHWTPEPLSTTDLYYGFFGPFSFTFDDKGGFAEGPNMLVFRYDWSYNYHVDFNGLPAHPVSLSFPFQVSVPPGYTLSIAIEATFSDITTDAGVPAANVVLADGFSLTNPLGGVGNLAQAETLTANDVFGGIETTIFDDTGINVSGSLVLAVEKLGGAVGGAGNLNIPIDPIPIPNVPWLVAGAVVVPEPHVHALLAAAVLGVWALVRRLRRGPEPR